MIGTAIKRNSILAVLAVLLTICLSGCSGSAEKKDDSATMPLEERVRLVASDVMESLKSHSTEVLSDLLCDRLHRDHPKLDQEIREFYDFMDGSIVSYDEPISYGGGGSNSVIFGTEEHVGALVQNIKTSSGEMYELYLNYTFWELEQPDKLRITCIKIQNVNAEGDYLERKDDFEEGPVCRIELSEKENEVRVPAIRSDPFGDTSEWELQDRKVYHNGEKVYELPDNVSHYRRGIDASFVDSDCAYLTYFRWEREWGETRIIVKSTQDGGAHWDSVSVPGEDIEGGCLHLSFVDREIGYLYFASDNVSDNIDALYITRDGGKHFTKVVTVNWKIAEGVMDMAFRTEEEGILLLYGDWYQFFAFTPIYAFRTTDGGKKWKKIDFDKKLWDKSYADNYYSYDYMSGIRLEREHMDSERWVATLVGVKKDRAEYLHYVSEDGWKTWEKYPVSEERKRYGVFFYD